MLSHFEGRDGITAVAELSVEPLIQSEPAAPEFEGTLLQLELQFLEPRRSDLESQLAEVGMVGMKDEDKVEYFAIPQRISGLKKLRR